MNEHALYRLENELVIHHPIFEEVCDEVLRVVQHGRSDSIISVLGPTGVGKTTLIRYLANLLVERQKAGWRGDHMPPLIVEAPSAEKKEFPWRGFMESILLALGEVKLNCKVDIDEALERKRKGHKASSSTKLSLGQLERLIKDRFRSFRPVAFFIDEAQNIVEDLSESARKANLNRIKYWANKFNTKIITFGTHESRYLLDVNEQLARRVRSIYFPRYRKLPTDLQGFAEFYKALILELDIKIDAKVRDDFDYIYNHSLGCPGILGGWLHDAIGHCLTKNLPKISRRTLDCCRMSCDSLRTAEIAIKEFEAYHESTFSEFDPGLVVPNDDKILDLQFGGPRGAPPKGSSKKPGKKTPKRYSVGAN